MAPTKEDSFSRKQHLGAPDADLVIAASNRESSGLLNALGLR